MVERLHLAGSEDGYHVDIPRRTRVVEIEIHVRLYCTSAGPDCRMVAGPEMTDWKVKVPVSPVYGKWQRARLDVTSRNGKIS
jgi:hypothetical protein